MTLTAVPGTGVWTGNVDGHWDTPGNWQDGVVPAAGAAVVFPAGVNQKAIVVDAPVTVGDIEMDGAYVFQYGTSPITVEGNIVANSPGAYFQNDVVLAHDTNVTVGASDDLMMLRVRDDGNARGITKLGDGKFVIAGSESSYTGLTEVAAGDLEVDTGISSIVQLDAGTTLSGNGSMNGIIGNGGTVSLSQGPQANSYAAEGNVTLGPGSTLHEVVSVDDGEMAGRLYVSGGVVDVTGATLTLDADVFTPESGDRITLISNRTGQPIVGTFDSLPEGATVMINGAPYAISYVGGDSGHDVTLTNRPPVQTTTPTVASGMGDSTTGLGTIDLSVLGADTSEAGEAGLTYTWSMQSSPGGGSGVRFSENGNNAAKNASVHFNSAGTYVLGCVISNGDNNTVSTSVTVHVQQTRTGVRLSPSGQHIRAGGMFRFVGAFVDQFKNAMPATMTATYSVLSGPGTIDRKGLFSAGRQKGHVVIGFSMGGFDTSVGVTVGGVVSARGGR